MFETQDRTDMIGQIRQIMPHIKDSDMEELGEQVLGELQNMTDEEFAEISLEASAVKNVSCRGCWIRCVQAIL